ncbi:MAG: MBL fold metallo-hydrolase [Hyphomicrobiaceae bacterium]|nr:MBL fold metallo-hydrolase [Hyphomicrobiaceae bacterium]
MTEPLFINSATVRAPEFLVMKRGRVRAIEIGVRYGFVSHPELGPVLIDTGYGPRATSSRERSVMLKLYGRVLNPVLHPEGQPLAVLERQGHSAADVRLIVVTHFHPDHISGLMDFPNAEFAVSGRAFEAMRRMGVLARLHRGIFSELLPHNFADRLRPIENGPIRDLGPALGPGHDLFGDGSCFAVDLPGHALGHFGLYWPSLSPPLLYAVDATWLSDALADRLPSGPARLVYEDADVMRRSARRVRDFAEAGGRVVLCHDRVGP